MQGERRLDPEATILREDKNRTIDAGFAPFALVRVLAEEGRSVRAVHPPGSPGSRLVPHLDLKKKVHRTLVLKRPRYELADAFHREALPERDRNASPKSRQKEHDTHGHAKACSRARFFTRTGLALHPLGRGHHDGGGNDGRDSPPAVSHCHLHGEMRKPTKRRLTAEEAFLIASRSRPGLHSAVFPLHEGVDEDAGISCSCFGHNTVMAPDGKFVYLLPIAGGDGHWRPPSLGLPRTQPKEVTVVDATTHKAVGTHPVFLCSCHSSVFDGVDDGEWIAGPAPRGLFRFRVHVDADAVEINKVEGDALSAVRVD
jgi:hypothetical protein